MQNKGAWKYEAIMAAVAVIFLTPIFFLLITAFKSEGEVLNLENIFPEEWTTSNFDQILGSAEEIPIWRWFMNSLFISSSITMLVLLVSSLSAYALVRLAPPGNRVLFSIIIGTMMVPGQILLVPMYLILNELGWIDTPMALIFPAGANAFGTFLLCQFFRGIPKDLEEAAHIDGCGLWGTYVHVILPLSKPVLATLGIFTFVGSWNDFISPLVFLDSLSQYTLPVGIALFQTSYYTQYGKTFAASLIATFPVIVAFLMFQKHIIKGVSLTGMKD